MTQKILKTHLATHKNCPSNPTTKQKEEQKKKKNKTKQNKKKKNLISTCSRCLNILKHNINKSSDEEK